jgi:hypothetical protein
VHGVGPAVLVGDVVGVGGVVRKGGCEPPQLLLVGVEGVQRALMKAVTIDTVRSFIGVGITAERSWMLKGGSCHGPRRNGGPAERKLSDSCRRTFRSRRCEMLLISSRMRRWRHVLFPPSVSTSVKLRAAYAMVELGPTALSMSLHMSLRFATPAHGLHVMRLMWV